MKKRAFILALMGAVIIAVLRTLQFKLFFDPATGFFTDNGIISACALAAALMIALAVGVSVKKDKSFFGRFKAKRNGVAGVGAAVSAVMMGICSYSMYMSFRAQELQGIKETSATGLSMRMPFIAATIVFAVFMAVAAVIFFTGSDLFGRFKVLHLISVLWGLFFILFVFIHYSISVLVTENIFVMFTAAAVVVAFLEVSKFYSGVNREGGVLRTAVVSASAAFMLSSGYAVSSMVKAALGESAKGDLPMDLVLIIFAAGIYLAATLWSSGYDLVVPEVKENTGGKRFKSAKK